MIRNVGGQSGGNVYNNSSGSTKSKEAVSSSSEKVSSKLENLKAAIENGEYKVDLEKLAKKMAEDLS